MYAVKNGKTIMTIDEIDENTMYMEHDWFGAMSKPNPERDDWFKKHTRFNIKFVDGCAVMTTGSGKHQWKTSKVLWTDIKSNGYLLIRTVDTYYGLFPYAVNLEKIRANWVMHKGNPLVGSKLKSGYLE